MDRVSNHLWGQPNCIDRISAALQKIHFGEAGHGAIETWLSQGGQHRGQQNCLCERSLVVRRH